MAEKQITPFYTDSTIVALTANFAKFEFRDKMETVVIENEAAAAIYFSWDGVSTHGKINTNGSFTLNNLMRIAVSGVDGRLVFPTYIYLKGTAGGEAYNISAW